MTSTDRIKLHIKNNRAGEPTFRITEERWQAACARHPKIADQVEVLIDWDLDRFRESIRTADAMVTWDLPTEGLGKLAPELRYIHIIGAGVEHLRPIDWLPPGCTLCNNRGVHAEKTAESALMAVLMLNNRIPHYVEDQKTKRWDPVFATLIAGKTVVVLGAGEMGTAAARAFKSVGLNVVGVRRGGKPRRPFDRMARPSELTAVVRDADFLHITLPMTEETRSLVDATVLDAMKPGAGLINFGRAPVLDHEALMQRLRSGQIGGAVLDVHEPEPLPETSPLWSCPNLILTPHVSSDDETDYIPKTLDVVFDNLGRMLAGRPLKNRVRPKLGY